MIEGQDGRFTQRLTQSGLHLKLKAYWPLRANGPATELYLNLQWPVTQIHLLDSELYSDRD